MSWFGPSAPTMSVPTQIVALRFELSAAADALEKAAYELRDLAERGREAGEAMEAAVRARRASQP